MGFSLGGNVPMIRCPKPPKKSHMVVLESAPGGRVEGGIAQCAIESAASNALFGSLIEGEFCNSRSLWEHVLLPHST